MAPKQTNLFPDYDARVVQSIVSLLRATRGATLKKVHELLRSHGAPFTGSTWGNIFDRRLEKALVDGKIRQGDLLSLLREAEEHGPQRVFLYRATAEIKSLLSPTRVARAVDRQGLGEIWNNPRFVVDAPEETTIADIRWDEHRTATKPLVLKAITRRVRQEIDKSKTERREDEPGWTWKTREITERGILVMKLSPSGVLEVRISAHELDSQSRYKDDLSTVWNTFGFVLPQKHFAPLSLSNARSRLNDARKDPKSKGRIKVSDLTGRNGRGITVTASVGDPDEDLEDEVGDFFDKPSSYCESILVTWLPQEHGPPSQKVRTRITENVNELVVSTPCSKGDYDFVLREITKHC